MPSFRSTAARITEPWVGAWVWASGSQVWNGNIGTLMPKPMNMPPKIQHLRGHRQRAGACRAATPCQSMIEGCRPSGDEEDSARKLTIIRAEPNSV